MLMDADGEPVTKVGDQFVVHMDREALGDLPLGHYDVTVTIERFTADREIAWSIKGAVGPASATSTATSSNPAKVGRWSRPTTTGRASTTTGASCGIFPVISEASLRATLGILERAVRRGYPKAADVRRAA